MKHFLSDVFTLLLLRGVQYSANNLWQKYNTKYQEIILTPGFSLFSRAGQGRAGQCIALQTGSLGQRSESGVNVLNEH